MTMPMTQARRGPEPPRPGPTANVPTELFWRLAHAVRDDLREQALDAARHGENFRIARLDHERELLDVELTEVQRRARYREGRG